MVYRYLLGFVVLIGFMLPTTTSLQGSCSVKADIVLLIDGSNSIQRSGKKATGDRDYYRNFVLKGLKDLVSKFNVDKDGTHISILFFGDSNMRTILKGYFMDFEDTQENIIKFINNLKSPNFRATYTDKGFDQAMKILNRSNRAKDSKIAKVILVLTDGMPTVPYSADLKAKKVKQKGIVVVPVAIGDELKKSTLRKWATKPQYVLQTKFDSFTEVVNQMQDVLCKAIVEEKPSAASVAVTPAPVITYTTTPEPVVVQKPSTGVCQVKADIVLLIDGSNSIQRSGKKATGDRDYYRNFVLEGLKDLVSKFNVDKEGTHISILFFGDSNMRAILRQGYFMDFEDTQENIIKFINNLKSPNFRATYTDKGFDQAMKILTRSNRAKDSKIAKVILVLTDGIPTVPYSADLKAKKVKQKGIVIVPIAIGDELKKSTLRKWATKPQYVLQTKFESFSEVVNQMQDILCKAIVEEKPSAASVAVTPAPVITYTTTPEPVVDQKPSPGVCQVKADIVLLIDGSNSIQRSGKKATGDKDYYRNFVLKGLKDLVSNFKVDKDGTHISILFFGDRNMKEILREGYFMDFEDREENIIKFINNVKSPNFKATFTDKGFDQSMKILNRSNRAKDSKIAKVILVLTDGIPTVPYSADLKAKKAKQKGIVIMPVAIGDELKKSTLRKWATKPQYVLQTKFESFSEVVNQMQDVLCKAIVEEKPSAASVAVTSAPVITYTTTPEPVVVQKPSTGVCQVKADIVLLIDGSNSIQRSGKKATGDKDYYRNFVLKGLRDLVSKFNVDKDGTHISILFFGDSNMRTILRQGYFMDFEDTQENIIKFINNLKSPNFRATYTDKGFDQSMKILNRSNRAKDSKIAKVILVLTDGMPTVPYSADLKAKKAKQNGDIIVPVAIGKELKKSTLRKWATKPEYVILTDFENFSGIVPKMQTVLCKAIVQEKPDAAITTTPAPGKTEPTPKPVATTSKPTTTVTTTTVPTTLATTSLEPVQDNPATTTTKESTPTPSPTTPTTASIAQTEPGFPTLAPWSCQWKYTDWNDDGGGKSVYLDRHLLSCDEGKAINYFHLERNDGKYRFKYRCCTTQLQCKNKRKETSFTNDGNGNTIYLDRQNVDCKNQYLSNFKLQRNNGAGKVKYTFICCEMPEEKTCIKEKTELNDDGGGNAVYLDRHEVKCKENYALAQFKLARSGSKYQYQYTCCRTNEPVGTTSMPSTTETTTTVTTTLATTSLEPVQDNPITTTTEEPTSTPSPTTPTTTSTAHTEPGFPTLAPWSCQWKYTDWNDDGGGKSVYLDRHLLSCDEGKAINYFHLESNGRKYRFKYRCCTTQLQCKNKRKETSFTNDGNGNTIYLDRQNVDCKDQYLSNFKLQRNNGGNKVKYTFICCEMPEEKTCIKEKTQLSDDGGGNAVYLDRHEVKCKENYALAQFKLARSGNNYQYLYTCCRTNEPVGTTSMPSTTETTTTVTTTLATTSLEPGNPITTTTEEPTSTTSQLTPTIPSTAQTEPGFPTLECITKADIILLIDGSGSVTTYGQRETGDNDYYKNYVFKMIKQIISLADVSKDKVNFGVLFFGSKNIDNVINQGWQMQIDKFYDKTDMLDWFDSKASVPKFGATYTAAAVEKALGMLQASPRYIDKKVGKAIFFMTDGWADDKEKVTSAFEKVKSQDIAVLTMGVGGYTDEKSIEKWASKPEYFQKAGFTGLEEKVKDIFSSMCKAIQEEIPQTNNNQKDNNKPNVVPDKRYCEIKYYDSNFCYNFEERFGDHISDSMVPKAGDLRCGAKLVPDSTLGGTVLSLMKKEGDCPAELYPWVDLKSFEGTCVSDPEKCTNGITVSFWLNVDEENGIKQMVTKGMKHQYFLSSGGQRSDSRGFVFLYQKDSLFEGYKLQVQTSTTDFVLELKKIPYGRWFHVAFTWSATEGLRYYEDGKKVDIKSSIIKKKYDTDLKTDLVIGKPNYGDKYFGRFMMDDLVIYYKVLSKDEIWYLNNGEYELPTNVYNYARWLWPFKVVSHDRTDTTVYTVEYFDGSKGGVNGGFNNGGTVYNGVFLGLARLDKSPARGYTLWIKAIGNYVSLGNFAGKCVSDPDLCETSPDYKIHIKDNKGKQIVDDKGLQRGLTVSFWLYITEKDIDTEGQSDQKHQYIISSGGQVSTSRGFAILYNSDTSRFKIQLQTSLYVYSLDFDLPLADPETMKDEGGRPNGGWVHVAFTWFSAEGLKLYIDGEFVQDADRKNIPHAADTNTMLTVGKPNHINKHFGRFKMDLLGIFYYVLTQPQIANLYFSKDQDPKAHSTTTTPKPTTTGSNPSGSTSTESPLIDGSPEGRPGLPPSNPSPTPPSSTELAEPTTPLIPGLYTVSTTVTDSDGNPAKPTPSTSTTDANGNPLETTPYPSATDSDGNQIAPTSGPSVTDANGNPIETTLGPTATDADGSPIETTLGPTATDADGSPIETTLGPTATDAYGNPIETTQGPTATDADGNPIETTPNPSATDSDGNLIVPTSGLTSTDANGNPIETTLGPTATDADGSPIETTLGPTATDADGSPIETTLGPTATDADGSPIETTLGPTTTDADGTLIKTTPEPSATDANGNPLQTTLDPSSTDSDGNPITPTSGPSVTDANGNPHQTTLDPSSTDSDGNPIETTPGSSDANGLPLGTTPAFPSTDSNGYLLATTPAPTDFSGLVVTTTVGKPTTNVKPASTPVQASTSAPIGDEVCPAKADIVFVIDNSGSIEADGRDGYFKQVKNFVKTVGKQFKIGEGANIGIVEASTDARIISKFGEIKDGSKFEKVLDKINLKKERAFLGKALELTRTELISKVVSKNVSKIVIVVTHGFSSDDVTMPAIELQDMGAVIFGIGYGDSQLKSITAESVASDPKDKHTFTFGYDQLIETAPKVIKTACEAAMETEDENNTNDDDGKPVEGGVTDGFKELFLAESGKYRRMHSAVAFIWSAELALKAQRWAEYLAKEDKLITKPKIRHGQTLYMTLNPGPISAQTCVRSWYNQIIYYDFQKPTVTESNSYFVQLIWRSTTEVGIGKFQAANGNNYIVAFYNPKGDSEGDLPYNVIGMTSSGLPGVPSSIRPDGHACPEGWQENFEYCYKLYSEAITWEEAAATCSAQKGSLASITHENEYSFITGILHTSKTGEAWIGLNDRVHPGHFTWVDGAPLSFSGWSHPPAIVIGRKRSDPVKKSNMKCVSISTTAGWQTKNCESTKSFVCKSVRPHDFIFMVTIHYPTQPWTPEVASGNTPIAIEIYQRVEKLITSVYGTLPWFISFTIYAFRGHVSTYIDVQLRFKPIAPIDPIGPLKEIAFTQDCLGFVCDLSDVQMLPAINITYNSTCSPSCYSSCDSSCLPPCCSPQAYHSYITYEVAQVSQMQHTAPPFVAPPPVMTPQWPRVPQQPIVPIAPQQPLVAPQSLSQMMPAEQPQQEYAYPSYCPSTCTNFCSSACPPQCCTQQGRRRKRKRSEILKLRKRYF